jgi:hypothetical protein
VRQRPGRACGAEGEGNRLEVGDDRWGPPVGDRSEREEGGGSRHGGSWAERGFGLSAGGRKERERREESLGWAGKRGERERERWRWVVTFFFSFIRVLQCVAMASTSTSFHDGSDTTPCVDESMLPADNGDETSRCEDEFMMPVDNEDDQIDDNFSSPRENEPMLSMDDAEDEPDAAAALWLPDVPIRNILARMPPSSATRFKVVSKSWRSMIADDSYA